MKRSIAAIGAAAIGLTGAAVAAVPAQAAATPDCVTSSDHTLKADPAAGNFYFDCIPQYGTGKAELSISNADGISDEFSVLESEDATLSGSVDDATASTYFSATTHAGIIIAGRGDSTATSQDYDAILATPISSITKIRATALPSDCLQGNVDYEGAYVVSFAPISITAKTTAGSGQTVGGPGKFFMAVRPQPLYLGLNFTGSAFDEDAPQCAVTGSTTYFAVDNSEANANQWQNATNTAGSLNPSVSMTPAKLTAIGAAAKLSVPGKIGYGSSSLTVAVSGSKRAGTVWAVIDGKRGDAVNVGTSGARVVVPSTLSIGKHTVVTRYSGDTVQNNAAKTSTLVVTKAPTVTTVKLSKSSAKAKSTRLTASTTVTVPGTSLTASGKVSFSVDGKVVKTVTLKNGKATGTLPVFTKKGTAKVVATYLGTSKLAKDASSTVKVTVK